MKRTYTQAEEAAWLAYLVTLLTPAERETLATLRADGAAALAAGDEAALRDVSSEFDRFIGGCSEIPPEGYVTDDGECLVERETDNDTMVSTSEALMGFELYETTRVLDKAMRASWGELLAAFDGAGLGTVTCSPTKPHIYIEAELLRRMSFCTNDLPGCPGWIEVTGHGERWTSLDALKAKLAQLADQVAYEAAQATRRAA